MPKPKLIETPQKLWELFVQYKEWAKANPFVVRDWVGGMGKEVMREKERPLTFDGFEVYLANQNVINDLGDYFKDKQDRYTEYAPIVTRIRKECTAEMFEGAAAGIYQQNIIARKIGLTEKIQEDGSKEITIKVKYDKGSNAEPTA